MVKMMKSTFEEEWKLLHEKESSLRQEDRAIAAKLSTIKADKDILVSNLIKSNIANTFWSAEPYFQYVKLTFVQDAPENRKLLDIVTANKKFIPYDGSIYLGTIDEAEIVLNVFENVDLTLICYFSDEGPQEKLAYFEKFINKLQIKIRLNDETLEEQQFIDQARMFIKNRS